MNHLEQFKAQSAKAGTIERIRAEDNTREILLAGVEQVVRDEVLLHATHPAPNWMVFDIPGHYRIIAHPVTLGPFVLNRCFHVVRRNWRKLWMRYRTVSAHSDLAAAMTAAER